MFVSNVLICLVPATSFLWLLSHRSVKLREIRCWKCRGLACNDLLGSLKPTTRGMHLNNATIYIHSASRISIPDCWLEVSMHPKGPAAGQLNHGFPWFSSVLEQMLSWYQNFTLLCIPLMQPPNINIKISLNVALLRLIKKFKVLYERTKSHFKVCPCFTLHLNFCIFKRLILTRPIFMSSPGRVGIVLGLLLLKI